MGVTLQNDRASVAQYVEKSSLPVSRIDRKTDEVMAPARDKTAIPNWLMPIICTAFVSLIVYIFTTIVQNIEKNYEKLERRIDTQETYMKNTREQLIAHGWTVDDNGNVKPPSKKEK
jgi:hypothetical protein